MGKMKNGTDETTKYQIPRYYKPNHFGQVIRVELHFFSDASVQGYGQCSYLRLEDEAHNAHCAFVMGKSRVAPLKPVTIPRLELTAAVCSVRISIGNHMISSAVWNKRARVNFSKTNKSARARRASALCSL